jgi:hypothetical protein
MPVPQNIVLLEKLIVSQHMEPVKVLLFHGTYATSFSVSSSNGVEVLCRIY